MPPATRVPPSGMAPAGKARRVLAAAFMARIAGLAVPIVSRTCVEAIERLLPPRRNGPVIPMMRIIALVNVAIKSARAVKPWPSSYEYPAREPIRSIVAIGRTIIGRIVKVAIRAHWRHTDVDGNLCGCRGKGTQCDGSYSG